MSQVAAVRLGDTTNRSRGPAQRVVWLIPAMSRLGDARLSVSASRLTAGVQAEAGAQAVAGLNEMVVATGSLIGCSSRTTRSVSATSRGRSPRQKLIPRSARSP